MPTSTDGFMKSIRHATTGQLLQIILLIALIARVSVVLMYGDFNNNYYWEYGEITKHLIHGEGYSYFTRMNDEVLHLYTPEAKAMPSAFMPPGYVLFLAPYLLIENPLWRNGLLLLTHILLSTLAVWLLYLLTSRMFGTRTGLLTALVAALLPEFLYASLSFTPTILYHVFVLLLFLLAGKKTKGKWDMITIGFLLSLLVLLRAEFALFTLFFVIILLLRKHIRKGMVVGAVVFASILPWTIRNYLAFDQIVPLTTGFGLNFYRGHNPDHIGSFGFDRVLPRLTDVEEKKFEVRMSQEFQRRAFAYIKENPGQEIINSAEKLIWFCGYIPFYPDSKNLLYLLPTVLIMVFWLYGIVRTYTWDMYWYFYLFFGISILISILFFPLPRYQTMMKILALPFAVQGALLFYKFLRVRKSAK